MDPLTIGQRVKIDNIGGVSQFQYSSTQLTGTIGMHGKVLSQIEHGLYLIRLEEKELTLAYYRRELIHV